MSGNYRLTPEGEPILEPNILEWAHWFEKANRHVAQNEIGAVFVSTVFLGLDHSFGQGPPILWETMIFGGKHDGYQERYSSRAAALVGHAAAVSLVKGPDSSRYAEHVKNGAGWTEKGWKP